MVNKQCIGRILTIEALNLILTQTESKPSSNCGVAACILIKYWRSIPTFRLMTPRSHWMTGSRSTSVSTPRLCSARPRWATWRRGAWLTPPPRPPSARSGCWTGARPRTTSSTASCSRRSWPDKSCSVMTSQEMNLDKCIEEYKSV